MNPYRHIEKAVEDLLSAAIAEEEKRRLKSTLLSDRLTKPRVSTTIEQAFHGWRPDLQHGDTVLVYDDVSRRRIHVSVEDTKTGEGREFIITHAAIVECRCEPWRLIADAIIKADQHLGMR